MPLLVLIMLHLFGLMSFLSGDTGSGSGDSDQGDDGQGDPPGDDGDGEGGDDDADDEADTSKLRDLVKKLRGEVRSAKRELKPLQRFKDETEAEFAKRKREQMTETERVASERDEALTKIAAANERVIRAEVRAQALTLGFHNVDNAWALIDRAAVTLDDAGEVKGAKEAVKALAAKEPHLIRADTGGGYGAPAGSRANSAPPDARQQTRANLQRLMSGRRAS